jgi:hypothetical protein
MKRAGVLGCWSHGAMRVQSQAPSAKRHVTIQRQTAKFCNDSWTSDLALSAWDLHRRITPLPHFSMNPTLPHSITPLPFTPPPHSA